MAAGRKTGGRAIGAMSAKTKAVVETLNAMNYDPITAMAKIAAGDMECVECKGQSPAQADCKRCKGTGRELISPELRGGMAKELAQFVFPKRKAVEHDGTVTISHEAALAELE